MKTNKITCGLVWSFAERMAAQLVSAIVTIILARILEPEHYGIISIVTVFITFCDVFVTSGFGSAIVQKKDSDDLDLNTAFALSFTLSVLIYVALFFAAPLIGTFYEMPQIVPVTRVMALRIPLASINSIQQATLRRQMAFKRFFVVSMIGTVSSGVIGIVMAMLDYGVWALVAQYMTNTVISTFVMFPLCGWKLKLQFSTVRAKAIFAFGWKVLATDMVSTLTNDINSLIVGKVFGSADLAFYDQGKKYPKYLVDSLNTAINKVMLPAYSQVQDDLTQLKHMLRKSIQLGVFLLAPVMIGFASVAEGFVEWILTDKWIESVPYIQIFCISYLTRPLETACHQALLAIGRSDAVLKVIIANSVTAISTLLIAAFLFRSVLLIAVGSVLMTMVSLLLFMSSTRKLLGYSTKEQLADILPALLCAVAMGAVVLVVGTAPVHSFVLLCLQVLAGAAVYIALSLLLQIPGSQYIKSMLARFFKKSDRSR